MTVFTEGRHPGEAILSEVQFQSRDIITIPAGTGVVQANTVLGEDSNGKFVPSTVAVADGAETATAVNIHQVDATDTDVQVAAIRRAAALNGSCLVYADDVDTDAKKATKAEQLAAVGVIVR